VLAELTSAARRLALAGLAKNTGKTVALTALLGELHAAGERVGVTSIGRDGEEHDVIDARIDKPRVELAAGDLVATTDALLEASGAEHEVLEHTGARTPLGRVVVARVTAPAAIEVAGPSAAVQVREAADAMIAHGAARVLVDGAIDRRAASSPSVADGLVLATGAVLGADVEEVVLATRRAVELVRLPTVPAALADSLAPLCALPGSGALVGAGVATELAPRFALTADQGALEALLDENPDAERLVLPGAVPEALLAQLAAALRQRRRELTVVAGDPTHIFLTEREPGWYRRQGLSLETVRAISLLALTVNPVAPMSHSLDSAALCAALREAIPDVAVLDVLSAA